MNSLSRTATCTLLLLFTQCQSNSTGAGIEEVDNITQAEISDPDGGPSNCGEDGMCRHSGCNIPDPDCADEPDDEPPPPPPPPPPTWTLTGAVSLTNVSGVSGSAFTLGTPTSSSSAVYALLSRERSDEPCYFAIGTENLNNAGSDAAPIEDLCGWRGPNSSTLHADYLDVNAGGADDHIFVRGVSVCMNSARTKVKGISVVGRQLTSSGAILTLGGSEDDTRTHCAGWESWQLCPSGQIATAVDAHFAAGNTPRDLTGIALHCRAVTP